MKKLSVKLKLLARTVVYDDASDRILLVRNKGADFWYAPGGGWEYDHETLQECAEREVYEETGLRVNLQRLLYVQEFHETPTSIFFETFWLAGLSHEQQLNLKHIDLDPNGNVEEARWFSRSELEAIQVFPKRLKTSFWRDIQNVALEDPFIGVR